MIGGGVSLTEGKSVIFFKKKEYLTFNGNDAFLNLKNLSLEN